MYERKDLDRMRDIRAKDPSKWKSLATSMAKKITDREKCHRRYRAAQYVFKDDLSISEIFLERYEELAGLPSKPKPQPVATAPVIPVAEEISGVPVVWGASLPQEEPLIGEATVKKGRLKEGILEIWKKWNSEVVHVFRPEGKPCPVGSSQNFYEGGTFLFGAKMVDYVEASYKNLAESKFGKPTAEIVYS